MDEALAFRIDRLVKLGYDDGKDKQLGRDLAKFLHLSDPNAWDSYGRGNMGRHWTKRREVTRRFQEPGNDMYHFTITAEWLGKGKAEFQEGWPSEYEVTLNKDTKLLVTQISVRKRKSAPEVDIILGRPFAGVASAIREVPPEWGSIKGVNAKSDGKKLWALKKAGKITDMKQMFAEAGKLEREYKRAHPGANVATRNGIVNAALRHEYDENGRIEQLYWPDDKRKGAQKVVKKATPTPAKKTVPAKKAVPSAKKVIDETPGGIKITKAAEPAKVAKPARGGKPTSGELHKELDELSKSIGELMNSLDFDSEDPKVKEHNREYYRGIVKPKMERMSEIEKLLEKVKPDRSRPLKDAKDLDELMAIWYDHNPAINLNGDWPEQLRKARIRHGGYADPMDKTVQALRSSLEGVDSILEKYPTLRIPGGINLYQPPNDRVSASFSQSCLPMLNINIDHLIKVNMTLRRHRADDGQWHPANFSASPYRSVMIHEMGHAVDWQGNKNPKFDPLTYDELDQGEERVAKDLRKIITDTFFEDHPHLKRLKVVEPYLWVTHDIPADVSEYPEWIPWLQSSKQLSGYSWSQENKFSKSEINYVEFLAESFCDVEINGIKSSRLAQAVHKYMVDQLHKHHPPKRHKTAGRTRVIDRGV